MSQHYRATLAGAVAAMLCGCGGSGGTGVPLVPRVVVGVKFAFEGTLTHSCNVPLGVVCEDAPFGTGVPVGTVVTGHFTVDSIAQAVRPGPTEPDVGAVKFYGVVADATVDGVTFSGNDVWASYAEIQTIGSSQWLRINVASGAQRGSLAGLTVDHMQISLRIVPTRSPDAKPPQDAAVFQAGIDPLYAPKIVLKHHSSVFVGILAPGPQVEGPLTAIK